MLLGHIYESHFSTEQHITSCKQFAFVVLLAKHMQQSEHFQELLFQMIFFTIFSARVNI